LTQNREINELTNAYYKIKDALISDDAITAGNQVDNFSNLIEAVSNSGLTESEEKVWKEYKSKLIYSSAVISKTADIRQQREQLNELSNALFSILKEFNTNNNAVYYQYCPMKKAYWLSNEKEVRNPYYGKQMMTCGSIKETLK
jgi:hypothetical protein